MSQTAKTALAGVVSWVLAADVLGLDQPFLAPWSAVLVVHATVYRSFSRGTQQVAATFMGVLLAWTAGQLFGLGATGMGVMLLLTFGLGLLRWWRAEATTMATTGVVVLATNAFAQANLLTVRLLDTSIGVGVGVLVNFLVWPPLRDRAAWSRIDQLPLELADLLDELGSGLSPELRPEETQEWVDHLRRIDVRVDEAWGLVRQARESSRFNPRRSRPAGLEEMDDVLHLVEQAVADVLSMVRTIATSAEDETAWDATFRSTWARLVTTTAAAVRHHDEATLRAVPRELGDLLESLSDDALVRSAWHEYGSLLVNLRNVVFALAEVIAWGNRYGPSERRSPRYELPTRVLAVRRPAGGRRFRGRDPGYAEHDED
ncbi:MAG: FUSC family protein [Marmoricola sp.]|nr:FUSC family protein [Marmoricola sp.]